MMKLFVVLSLLSSDDPPIFSALLSQFKLTPMGLNPRPGKMRQTEQDPFRNASVDLLLSWGLLLSKVFCRFPAHWEGRAQI